jgi:hypothetical protein
VKNAGAMGRMADLISKSHRGGSVPSLASSLALLIAVIAPVALVVAVLYQRQLSAQALLDAAVGGTICWLAASFGLIATFLGNRLQSPVQGMLIGMIFRMGLPLAAVVGLPNVHGLLGSRGITTTILGVYLVALVAETLLALRLIPTRQSVARAT